MQYFVNQKQMKRIDYGSINDTGIPSILLMERASVCVADAVCDLVSSSCGRVVIVSGMGNNGADGLACARILHCRGYHTLVLSVGKEEKATPEWKLQKQMILNLDIPMLTYTKETAKDFVYELAYPGNAIFVDALFGIGLTREVTGDFKRVIDVINTCQLPKVSVDIASGINTDSGHVEGCAVKADVTVTFGRKKLGQILYPGAEYTGKLILKEVGFDPVRIKEAGFSAFTYDKEDLKALLPVRGKNTHKTSFGEVFAIAGSPGMAGAAAFSAKSCYRSGCGYVRVFTPVENVNAMLSLVPEAVLSVYQRDEPEKMKESFGLAFSRAKALVFGPGLGLDDPMAELLSWVLSAVKDSDKKLLIDADGLRLLAQEKLIGELNDQMVLTPHMGEMAAITGRSVRELVLDPIGAALSFSRQTGAVCVLKGARTVVTDGKQVYINTSGSDALATAGSGDVLSGMIAAFLAEGMACFEAACLGVFVHGLCGEDAGERLSNRSVMASDLTESICNVLR